MYPILLKIGPITISSYGVMVAIAFLVAYKISETEFERRGIDKDLLGPLLIVNVIGGLVGAKILFLFENVTFSEFISDPTRYLASGLTFLGGFLGALILILLVIWWKRVSFWRIADAIIPALVIGYAIARIGCFLVGDDYGIPSDLPWAIPFPQGAPPTDIAVHPTQIYETVLMAGAFAFLWRIRKRVAPTGWLASIGFILMGIERFGIEFIRNTTPSPIPGLTIAQVMSFFLIVWGLVKIIQLKTISAEKLVTFYIGKR